MLCRPCLLRRSGQQASGNREGLSCKGATENMRCCVQFFAGKGEKRPSLGRPTQRLSAARPGQPREDPPDDRRLLRGARVPGPARQPPPLRVRKLGKLANFCKFLQIVYKSLISLNLLNLANFCQILAALRGNSMAPRREVKRPDDLGAALEACRSQNLVPRRLLPS